MIIYLIRLFLISCTDNIRMDIFDLIVYTYSLYAGKVGLNDSAPDETGPFAPAAEGNIGRTG